MESTGVNRI